MTTHCNRAWLSSVARPWIILAMLLLSAIQVPTARGDAPTQEDVFKSIQDNVGSSDGDSRKLLLFLCIGGGVVILLALFSQREKRQTEIRPVNHHGRLISEVTRGLSLKKRDLKQLKILADQTRLADGTKLKSPLALVLCPSVVARAVQDPKCKADRRVLDQILQKTYRAAAARTAAKRRLPGGK